MFGVLVHLDTVQVIFKGHRPKVTITGGKMVLRWLVQCQVKAFYSTF